MQKVQKVCQNCGYIHVGICAANMTDFVWRHGGNQIFLTGSWNQWQTQIKLSQSDDNPLVFSCTMNLQAGAYQYKFIVDGKWTYDHSQNSQEDGFGSYNNFIEVVPRLVLYEDNESEEDEATLEYIEGQGKGIDSTSNGQHWENQRIIKITTTLDSPDIRVKGDWDNWQGEALMNRVFNNCKNNYENVVRIKMGPGRHEFKFVCNGIYMHDPNQKHNKNEFGTCNNVIYVEQTDHWNPLASKKQNKSDELDYSKLAWKSQSFHHSSWEKISGQIQGHSMNRVGDSIFIFGGYRGSYLDTMWEMNVHTYEMDIIDTKGSTPDARGYHGINNFGNKLLMYGGMNKEKNHRDYFVYNTSTKSWDPADNRGPKPSQREHYSLTILKKKALISFGGYYCTSDFEAEFHYNDLHSLNLQNLTWTELKPEDTLPEPRFSHSASIYKSTMIVFGGMQSSPSKNYNDVWAINLERDNELKWENWTSQITGTPPAPRHGHIAILGRGDNKQLFNDTFILDIKNKQWIQPNIEGEPPRPRYYHAACLLDKEIVIFGGNSSFGNFGSKQKNKKLYILKFDDKKEEKGKILKNGFIEGEDEESKAN